MDFGGSGIKGAPVDLVAGDFAADRVRIETPQPATPGAVAAVVAELLAQFPETTGTVGVPVPGVVRRGVVSSAANIDASWIGTDAETLLTEATGHEVHIVNDADAAGVAEVAFGAARGQQGLVVVTTLCWWLFDAGPGDHALPNVGITVFGVMYVGGLGSFAALLLKFPDGVGMLKVTSRIPVQNGDQIIVEGTFTRRRQGGRLTVYNEVNALTIRPLNQFNADLVG